MTAMRVVVAAGSGLRRAAMVQLLEDAGFVAAGQAGDAGDLLRKVRAHRPNVAIAELPDTDRALDEFVHVLRTIRSEFPRVGVLLISQDVDARHAAALLEPGADGAGYLLDGHVTAVARFIDAVHEVAACGSVLDPAVVSWLMTRDRRDPAFEVLSDRDREVLAQMATGLSNRGIAQRMFLSERSIERHVKSIFDALGITSAAQANRRVLAVLAYLRGAEPA